MLTSYSFPKVKTKSSWLEDAKLRSRDLNKIPQVDTYLFGKLYLWRVNTSNHVETHRTPEIMDAESPPTSEKVKPAPQISPPQAQVRHRSHLRKILC